jgi:glycine hydroxymethyltransferase
MPAFSDYNHAVLENSRVLAKTLSQRNVRIVSGGTDCGLMLVDLQSRAITGADAVDHLENAGLTCNKNMIPFDPQPAEIASGLRLSVNAGTARGFLATDFEHIGQWIADVLDDLANARESSSVVPATRECIRSLCAQYPIYQ